MKRFAQPSEIMRFGRVHTKSQSNFLVAGGMDNGTTAPSAD